MKSFIDLVQYFKLQSLSLKEVYFSGNLDCIIISNGPDDISFLFKSDSSICLEINGSEKVFMEKCTIEEMKQVFDLVFKRRI